MRWSPLLLKKAKDLKKQMAEFAVEDLESELSVQINSKISTFSKAMQRIASYKYNRDTNEVPVVWQKGSCRVLDYSLPEADGEVILFIPSLINRSYILDISEKRSLVKYLAKKNYRVFLVDWQEPKNSELNFAIDDYINERLEPIINSLNKKTNSEIIVAGYCMGGLLALACSVLFADKIKALALLATPWNFHSDDFTRINIDSDAANIVKEILSSNKRVHGTALQSLFYYLYPDAIWHKIESMASIDFSKGGSDVEDFLALEHWANDGISMTGRVAGECFFNFIGENATFKNSWKICGKIINPSEIKMPVFFAIPEKDVIVPKTSSLPLTSLIKNKEIIYPDSGHIGMVAGRQSRDVLWKPFDKWLCSI